MASPDPPPPPPPHNNGGRGQGCAPRGWELLRHLQVRPPRRPRSGLNAEGSMSNPGRYRGGGTPIEFVRGGMGRGRRPNYFVNRGRGAVVQQRNSLGAIPDCVPQASSYPYTVIPDEPPLIEQQPQTEQELQTDRPPQEEHSGSGNQIEEVGNDLSTVHVSDSGQQPVQPSQPITQAGEVPFFPPMNEIHAGLHTANPVPPIPVLPTVAVPLAGQCVSNPMPPIPLLQTVTDANTAAMMNERGAGFFIGPILPREQNTQHVPTTAFALTAYSHMFITRNVCPVPDPFLVSDMTRVIISTCIPTLTDVTRSGPVITEVQNILERSTLSPNAKEFIPSSKRVPTQLSRSPGTDRNITESYPSSCTGYVLNNVGESVPGSLVKETIDYTASNNSAYGCQDKADSELLENWSYTEMIETLQLVQFELVKHPANFNNMMKNITPALLQWLQLNLAVPMVEFIISMATQQDNFGYIAARMCVYVSNLDPSNIFRSSLIERCHAMCQNIGEEKKSVTFLGFVMFLAELYVQFKNERGQRVNVIGTGLLECLENLISEPVICDNLKFVCNALKLAGYYLDTDTDLKSAMNQLMTHIQSVMTAVGLDNIDKRIYDQLQKLIDMRNNNWDNQGAASVESQDPLDGTSHSATYYSEAVFYGPDGQVLTLEESQFLTENQSMAECIQNEYDEDSSKEDSNDSMDEEMQDAYEQFLQMVPEAR